MYLGHSACEIPYCRIFSDWYLVHVCFYNDWSPLCEFSSSLFKLSFPIVRWNRLSIFPMWRRPPSIARRPTHVLLFNCIWLHITGPAECAVAIEHLYHYASMHLWLKLLCLDFCLCLLKIIIAINHSTVYHYLIAFVVWYHDGIFQRIDLCHWWSHWT